jgi:hypothetical protein
MTTVSRLLWTLDPSQRMPKKKKKGKRGSKKKIGHNTGEGRMAI